MISTIFLGKSEQFGKMLPTALMALCYAGSFYPVAVVGIGLIVTGVVLVQAFSTSTAH
ncbi:hypothetical protein [Massilia scottii]|uniref:hypothetical protein n=1 Tax=Massilia scottii TaxID=3057166 RepID=UPI002796B940|nr:hypothetical protein [Massilia sp. CCM 9029]MDQ1833379.1 hypothetical protein [Massilia sp. CCM 9029]